MATEKKAQVLQLDPPHELIFKGRASGLYGCLTDDPCVGGFNEIGFRRDVRIKMLYLLRVENMYMYIQVLFAALVLEVLARFSLVIGKCVTY